MKKIFYLSLVTCALSFTSCINIIEELFLNKDGTGQYLVTIDMSQIMENGGMRSMLQQFGGEDLNTKDNPFAGDEPVEVDTVMFMKDAPDSIRTAFGNDDLLKRVSIHQMISESKEVMKTIFSLDFKKMSEVDEFLNQLDKLQSSDSSSPMAGGGGLLPSGNGTMKLFQLAGRNLTRFPSAQPKEEINEEEMGMVKMMLADATYKVIYHLPGKVKKTTMKNAVIDDKMVTVEFPLMDSMEGNAKIDGLIKFKKR